MMSAIAEKAVIAPKLVPDIGLLTLGLASHFF
jgi:hypothetical protein